MRLKLTGYVRDGAGRHPPGSIFVCEEDSGRRLISLGVAVLLPKEETLVPSKKTEGFALTVDLERRGRELGRKKRAELVGIAEALGIEVPEEMTRVDIINMIVESEGW